jgi:hypothetical protein
MGRLIPVPEEVAREKPVIRTANLSVVMERQVRLQALRSFVLAAVTVVEETALQEWVQLLLMVEVDLVEALAVWKAQRAKMEKVVEVEVPVEVL